MKFRIVVEQILDVEAETLKDAIKLLREEPPFVSIVGVGLHESLKSRNRVKIVSIEKKGQKK